MSSFKKAINDPAKAVTVVREKVIDHYVSGRNFFHRSRPEPEFQTIEKAFREILEFSKRPSDISDHLPVLYAESVRRKPEMIVELGVRRGSSTFVFERVAERFNCPIVSVDIEDCSSSSSYPHWTFVHADDVAFADEFPAWCKKRSLPETIDVLFIDTSHEYEHTVAEIDAWFQHLSPGALVFFHDTNMREVYSRADGSLGHGWKNDRGVIQAVEEFLNCRLDESVNFTCLVDGWLVRHHANCSGLTILEKLD
jgi:cephalosporin hydroxylase